MRFSAVVMMSPAVSALLFVACSGSDPSPTGASSASSASSSSGGPPPASPSSSTSSGGADAGEDASSSSGGLPLGPCAVSAADATCRLSVDTEGVAMNVASALSVTVGGNCTTSLYAGASTDDLRKGKLRRYFLSKHDPCTFVRDTTLPEVDTFGAIAVDDAANVWEADYSVVARVAPGPRIDCDMTQVPDIADYLPTAIAMARDGKTGFAAYVKVAPPDRLLVKVTATAQACAVTAFTPTGTTLSGVQGLAVDAKGRLHIADAAFVGGNKRGVILDASGVFVSSYNTRASGALFRDLTGITACRGGMCLVEYEQQGEYNVIGVTDDGVFRSEATFTPPAGFAVLVGSAAGPLFMTGTRGKSPPYAFQASMLKDR